MVVARKRFAAIVALTVMFLNGCAREEPAATPTAAEPEPTQASAQTDQLRSTCAEDDIECEERLYQLEETLFAYESVVGKQVDELAQACWQTDVDSFRRSVDACNSIECKEQALLRRIASLHLLQSEEQRAALYLPEVPLLIAVLAPSAETPLAQPDPTHLFEVSGSLIHATAHPEHLGIAVNVDEKDHVFLFEMDMDHQPGQSEVLGLVGTSPTSRVLVRGYPRVAPTGVANFDPDHCRWVYELP
jgi:hypothetical protein